MQSYSHMEYQSLLPSFPPPLPPAIVDLEWYFYHHHYLPYKSSLDKTNHNFFHITQQWITSIFPSPLLSASDSHASPSFPLKPITKKHTYPKNKHYPCLLSSKFFEIIPLSNEHSSSISLNPDVNRLCNFQIMVNYTLS